MTRLLVGRLSQTVFILALVSIATFALIHAAPGDPFAGALDHPSTTEDIRSEWRKSYGLDRPLHIQFALYSRELIRGNLGWSFSAHRPVSQAIAAALPNTLLLMTVALAAAFAVGIPLGRLQAARRGSATDRAVDRGTLLFVSMPDFWLAIVILLVFSHWIPVFPIGGSVDPVMHANYSEAGKLLDRLHHLVLPAATLTLVLAATVARYQRAALLEVLPLDFIRTARAKGVNDRTIVRRHAGRNALIPIVTLAGLALPALFTGAVFIEKIFSWPGMGLLIVNGISSRDYPLVMGAVVAASALVALGSLATDMLYVIVDPRIRHRGDAG